jgi:hypothetical protein
MIPVQPPQGQPMQGSPQQQQSGPVTIDAVMALLRDGAMRRFRIDIEVDSTITGDESQERQDRNQFIESITKFVQAWGPIVAANPLMADLAGEFMLFGTRAFRVGRSLEEVIEETVDKLEQQAAQPKPPPPLPPIEQAKLAITQQKGQAEVQRANAGVQAAQTKAKAETDKAQLEMFHSKIQHETTLQLAREKATMDKEAMLLDAEIKSRQDQRAHELHALKLTHERQAHAQSIEKLHHDAAVTRDTASHSLALKEKQSASGEQAKQETKESKSKLEKLFADISKAVTSKKKVSRDSSGNLIIEHSDK